MRPSPTLLLVLAYASACARPGPLLPDDTAARWSVGVVAASGERTLTALYTLESEALSRDTWTLRTVRTEGTWEEHGRVLEFDSEARREGDPWPLTMQHLVASVPIAVHLDDHGRPSELVDPEGWSRQARAELYGSDLPARALSAGESLVDPAGMLADLQRTFPGEPDESSPWQRPERLAGLDVLRVEACTSHRDGRERTWECSGVVQGPTSGPARLHDTTCETRVTFDNDGLVRVESSFSGTLVLAASDHVLDRPIGGRRVVERQ